MTDGWNSRRRNVRVTFKRYYFKSIGDLTDGSVPRHQRNADEDTTIDSVTLPAPSSFDRNFYIRQQWREHENQITPTGTRDGRFAKFHGRESFPPKSNVCLV